MEVDSAISLLIIVSMLELLFSYLHVKQSFKPFLLDILNLHRCIIFLSSCETLFQTILIRDTKIISVHGKNL